MTTAPWSEQVPADEILARARQVRLSAVLVTVICGFFFAIGWLAGHAWLAVALCGVSVRYGFRQAVPAKPAAVPAQPDPRGSKL
jgi:hypothetical protein